MPRDAIRGVYAILAGIIALSLLIPATHAFILMDNPIAWTGPTVPSPGAFLMGARIAIAACGGVIALGILEIVASPVVFAVLERIGSRDRGDSRGDVNG